MLAPGNINRMHLMLPDFHFSLSLLLEHFRGAWLDVIIGESFLCLPIIFLLATRRTLDTKIIAFSLAALLVPTIMIFSPLFTSYTCLSSTVFLLIASTAAIDQIDLKRSMPVRALAIILSLIGALSMLLSVWADYGLYRQLNAQLELIEQHRNDACIELPAMTYDETAIELLGGRVLEPYNYRHHTEGIADDPNEFYTRAFAKYHGLNAVRLIDDTH